MYKKNYDWFLKGYRWDDEQTRILIENFRAGKSVNEITILINQHIKNSRPGAVKTIRTYDSVAYKLQKLGLITEEKLDNLLKAKKFNVQFNRLNNYEEIREKILKRDRNKCIICGSKERLQMAHIVPFRETFKSMEQELVTLCKKDHILFDELNEFETKKVFDYMKKIYSDYDKKYKITYRYNPVTNRDLCEVKRVGG